MRRQKENSSSRALRGAVSALFTVVVSRKVFF